MMALGSMMLFVKTPLSIDIFMMKNEGNFARRNLSITGL